LFHASTPCSSTSKCSWFAILTPPLLLRFRSEIPQEALQRLLIVVVLLPLRKIADLPAAAHISRPGFGRLHHRLIQAQGEKHWPLLAVFFLASGHHFAFHPRALDGVLGEYEYQLVIKTNRFFDELMIVVAYLEVFRREPSAHTLALQISVKPLGKGLIPT